MFDILAVRVATFSQARIDHVYHESIIDFFAIGIRHELHCVRVELVSDLRIGDLEAKFPERHLGRQREGLVDNAYYVQIVGCGCNSCDARLNGSYQTLPWFDEAWFKFPVSILGFPFGGDISVYQSQHALHRRVATGLAQQ
jgi:hypothetical protein